MWVVVQEKFVRPINVRVGITDGISTEVQGPDLKEGMEVVTGHQQAAAGAQTSKAQVRLNYTEIHAPIAGVISVLAARQGEVVNIGQPIVSIINPDELWVRADMPETFLDRVRLGDMLPVRFPDCRESKGTIFYRGVDADYRRIGYFRPALRVHRRRRGQEARVPARDLPGDRRPLRRPPPTPARSAWRTTA